jgi:drug/metabolite transporter (DMT)-like permease
MFMNIPPFIAIIVSFFALGDPIRAAQIAGGILILAGVAIANMKHRQPQVSSAGIV